MSHMRKVPNTFRDGGPKEGYVAGLGRGALGFTTNADVGPLLARSGRGTGVIPTGHGQGRVIMERTNFGQAPANYVPGAGRGASGFGESKQADVGVEQDQTRGRAGFDQGGSRNFADAGDEEADVIWQQIDDRMKEKRKRHREKQEKLAAEELKKSKMRIADQFADLKQQLKTVQFEEWDKIPEAGTGIRAHKRDDLYTPLTDSIILSNASSSSSQDLGLNVQRGRMIRDQLDAEGNKATTSMDPTEYLKSMESGGGSEAQIGDIKKARLLFKSVTSTNPTHAPGWIAAARLEEVAGKLLDARKIIQQGCTTCPESEDIWIEAVRLNTPANAKVIIQNGLQHLKKSSKLWKLAADLEGNDSVRKKRVLRRALEVLPTSEDLWKALIELEKRTEAHILLAKAVECVPESLDLWLALAQMEDYANARIVLNRAGKFLPKEPKIWIAACALEEANSPHTESIDTIVARLEPLLQKAIKSLELTRMMWLDQAVELEGGGSPATCKAIVRATLTLGLPDEKDSRKVWTDDAGRFEKSGNHEIAREFHRVLLEKFPGQKQILLRAIAFETRCGTKVTLRTLLDYAVQSCPKAELFWLMAAKESWKTSNDVPGARDFFERAFKAGHKSERYFLALLKLEWETGATDRAREVLSQGRACCNSEKIWIKSALLERVEYVNSKAPNLALMKIREILRDGLKQFPQSEKLWLMSGQLELEHVAESPNATEAEKKEAVKVARELFVNGVKNCPNGTLLWIHAAKLEEKYESVVKARSVLELARAKNEKSPELWLEAVRLERRHGQEEMANTVMSKALQACPKSGILWAEHVVTAPKPERRSRSADAFQACEQDALVMCAIAKVLALERKKKGARKWFENAVTANPDYGDAWGEYYIFEKDIVQSDTNAEMIYKRCIAAEPKHGEKWQQISKTDENRMATTEDILKLYYANNT